MPGFPARPASDRFHNKYQPDSDTGCWNWTGSISNKGYGRMTEKQPDGRRRTIYAHRVSYEMHHGPITDDRVVDHMCDNPHCVNPDHLQLLTHKQNVLRSTAPHMVAYWTGLCLRGHDRTDPTIGYRRPDNGRVMCRECMRLRQQRRNWQKRRST